MLVELDTAVWIALVGHAREARPAEACGLVAASGPVSGRRLLQVNRYHPLTNWSASLQRYRIDPVEFARAEHSLRRQGLAVCGFYHSHPDAGPLPSAADEAGAWPDMLQLILGLEPAGIAPELRAWWPAHGRLHQLSLRVRTSTTGAGPTMALDGQRWPTMAHDGQRWPTMASAARS